MNSYGEDRVRDLELKVRHQDAELQIFKEFGKESFTTLDFSLKLERFLEIVSTAVDIDLAAAFLVAKDGSLVLAASKGVLAKEVEERLPQMSGAIASAAITGGQTKLCRSLSGEPIWIEDIASLVDRETIAVPLKFRGKITGALQVISQAGTGPFTDEDLEFLTGLTRQFSIVAEKSYVFNDLEARIKDSLILSEVGTILISTLQEQVIRHRAMTAITDLLDVEAGSLLLIDEDKGDLFFEVAIGQYGAKLKGLRLEMGEGIAGWVASHDEPLIINDVSRDERFEETVDEYSDFVTRNTLCVPVKSKGKMIGVLEAVNKLSGAFTEKDLGVFKHFSQQVAIALDNARLYAELRQTFIATSEALAESIDKRDPYTGGHTKRVVRYSLVIGQYMGLSEDVLELLKLSAILHDIGKIGIDDAILRKEGPLNDAEFDIMKDHPVIGADILAMVPQLKDVIPGVLHHHERVDGTGYPDRAKGEEIPLIARIISVSDTYDAMTTTRAYRNGLDNQVAIDELVKCSGTQFDGDIVKAFLSAIKEGKVEEIKHVSFSELKLK